jgi:hypothetical protein
MNHHADKPYAAEASQAGQDRSVDSVVLAVHGCPECGTTAAHLSAE